MELLGDALVSKISVLPHGPHAILWFFPVPPRKVLFSSLLESPTHVRARTPYYPVRKRTYSVTIQHRPFRT